MGGREHPVLVVEQLPHLWAQHYREIDTRILNLAEYLCQEILEPPTERFPQDGSADYIVSQYSYVRESLQDFEVDCHGVWLFRSLEDHRHAKAARRALADIVPFSLGMRQSVELCFSIPRSEVPIEERRLISRRRRHMIRQWDRWVTAARESTDEVPSLSRRRIRAGVNAAHALSERIGTALRPDG